MPPKLNRQRALFVLTKIDESSRGNSGKRPSATPSSWNWDAISAKCGRDSTGGWKSEIV